MILKFTIKHEKSVENYFHVFLKYKRWQSALHVFIFKLVNDSQFHLQIQVFKVILYALRRL